MIIKSLISIVAISVALIAVPVQAKKLKMAVGDALGGTQGALGEEFARLLKEKTNGKLTVDLFDNGQLGSEQDTVNNAAMGTLDLSIVAINNITPFSPTVGPLTLPYMIKGNDEAYKLVNGKFGKIFIENTIRDAKVRILAWGFSGFRVLTNSKRPVKTVDDLKGLVIRVPKNEIMIATYKAWGVNPTPMSWAETFTALQQGVVDGQDTPYITIAAMKFYTVQKYVTNIHYLYLIEPLIISEKKFQRFSKTEQKVILDAGKEATQFSLKYINDNEKRIKKDFISKGMIIDNPDDSEREFIKLAKEKVWPAMYNKVGGKKFVDDIVNSMNR